MLKWKMKRRKTILDSSLWRMSDEDDLSQRCTTTDAPITSVARVQRERSHFGVRVNVYFFIVKIYLLTEAEGSE